MEVDHDAVVSDGIAQAGVRDEFNAWWWHGQWAHGDDSCDVGLSEEGVVGVEWQRLGEWTRARSCAASGGGWVASKWGASSGRPQWDGARCGRSGAWRWEPAQWGRGWYRSGGLRGDGRRRRGIRGSCCGVGRGCGCSACRSGSTGNGRGTGTGLAPSGSGDSRGLVVVLRRPSWGRAWVRSLAYAFAAVSSLSHQV